MHWVAPFTTTRASASHKFFCEITQKYSLNSQYSSRHSLRSETTSGNWKPLKNHKKYFSFYLNKLNVFLANQILNILCISIQPNIWYSWSLKISFIKRRFLVNFIKILKGRHFVVGGPKTFKLLADIFFESSLQNIVLSSLLLFLCACY